MEQSLIDNDPAEVLSDILFRIFGENDSIYDANPCGEVSMGGNGNECVLKTNEKYDDDVRFSYYGCHDQCNHHKGVLVIASYINRKAQVVHYGTAYCSPKDVYNKEMGKSISYQDLIENMNTTALGKVAHHIINARILADIIANNDAPSWAEILVADSLGMHLYDAYHSKRGGK